MDSDADDADASVSRASSADGPHGETERPSLFGAVMRGASTGPGQNRGGRRARNYEPDGIANSGGDDCFARGGGIDVVEATRFPSANDNTMSTPSPKSRRHSQGGSRGQGSGGGSGGRRGGGLFGDLGGDGSNSGSNGRFAGVASPGGYGIMDILNNMDDDTHHFDDSNFDKVESPSKPSKGVNNGDEGDEEEGIDEAPPKWKEATFVIPGWLPMTATKIGTSTSPASVSPRSEEEEDGEGQQVRIKQESQSEVQRDGFGEDEDAYDLPTQPPADAQNNKRKRSALDAEAVPSGNDPSEASPDALAPPALTVGVLDWSLKRRLRLECFPRRALPLSSSSSGHEAVDRLAAQIFLRPSTSSGFDEVGNNDSADRLRSTAGMPVEDPTIIAAAHFRAAQMYWRHPAIYPLPPQLLMSAQIASSKGGRIIQAAGGGSFSNVGSSSTRNNNPAKKALRFASSSTRTSTEDEAVAIREAADKIQQRQAASLSAMGFGSAAVAGFGEAGSTLLALMDNPSEIIRRRQSEWAEAFRSMYYTWLERIDGLRVVDHQFLSVDDVARTYFYLVSPSQTILFRCQVQYHSKDDMEDEDNAYTIEPVIVLSSTTSGLRSELRHMGVSIFVLYDASTERPDQDEEGQGERTFDHLFDESMFDFKVDSSERSKVEEDEARKVREELEALRRAGAQGRAAGAEISVSVGKKKESMSQEARGKDDDQMFRPLYVKGDDDCMAIFELLLNTRGRLFGGEDDNNDGAESDIPLLLHRSLGPTKNASIGTLSETMRLDENYNELKMLRDQEVKISDIPTDDETPAKLQINGPILPCAFRDLMSASICHLVLDEMKEAKGREEDDSIANDDNVGSHYLIWYPTRQEGFGADNSLTVTKSKSSGREYSKKKAAKRLAMYKRETGNPTSSHFNGGDLDQDMDELLMGNGERQDDGQGRIAVGNCGSQQLLKQVIWVSGRRNVLTYSTASVLD